ncbi:MAG: agmatinase [Acidimicrobiia bacterium]|nr:agmatinase [Acidimicrobiia bacterium]
MTDVRTSHDGDFANRTTFAGAPTAALDDLDDIDVAIVGAPFDWGTTNRPGARFGPAAIRSGDYFGAHGSRTHLPTGIDPFAEMRVADIGDFNVVPGYVEESVTRIRAGIRQIAEQDTVPIVLGGDHTITFPDAGGVADVHGHGEIALIHFDAHADTGDTQNGQLLGHATPMRRLIEEGSVPGHRFVQIGLRGYWPPPDIVAWMREQNMRSYLMNEIVDRGLRAVVDEAVAYALEGATKAFISVDVDVVDPGMAPGTGTPEPGGLTSRELLDTVRRLARDLEVVGADIVEVSPPYDGPGQITASLANRVVLEILNGMAERKLGHSGRATH